MKTLIIGAGEVGHSLRQIIEDIHDTSIRDIYEVDGYGFKILQICYPDSDKFVEITKRYIKQYKPKLTIINSSVRIGTTDLCGKHVVYSPVRGRHPNIANEMKSFTKYVSGRDKADVRLAQKYFIQCGLEVSIDNNPINLELSKLLSNIHMGVEIAWRQEVSRILDNFKASKEVYEEWERTYSEGYLLLNQMNLMRPRMRSNPIGGHCILECTEILSRDYPSKIFEFIKESNERAKN